MSEQSSASDTPDLPVSLFDFDLPEELIALRPVRPRPAARLLVADASGQHDRHVHELRQILRPGDVLVFNDTKVLPVRLTGLRRRDGFEARIEATLIERLRPDQWRAFAKPGKRLKLGDRIVFSDALSCAVTGKAEDGTVLLDFPLAGGALDAAIAGCGAMPLPPYIAAKRAPDAQDFEDYQTVMAREAGAVAAPTAALHFDEPLLQDLRDLGVGIETVTLHVGAGTFLPVKAESTGAHKMHFETGVITDEAAANLAKSRAKGGRIIAVGTTSLRVLETASRATGEITGWSGSTDIFITPGFPVRSIDGLITNFHLPRSTLFMLVSAIMGVDRMKSVYEHAISRKYRFFSYGDASLLLP